LSPVDHEVVVTVAASTDNNFMINLLAGTAGTGGAWRVHLGARLW
jgi:hypothetical protein